MIGFLIFWACIFGYVTIAVALTPVFYKELRGRVVNRYPALYAHDRHHDARQKAYLHAWFWPIGFFLFIAKNLTYRVDEKAELDAKERRELERLRRDALKDIENL